MKITHTLPAPGRVDDASHAAADVASRLKSAIANAFAALQRARDERRMRDQLATMDDNLLLDIGIERDEIARVRIGEKFTPRRWQAQLDA